MTSDIANRLYAVVNVNALENVDPSRLRRSAANFEGEEVESASRAANATGSPMFASSEAATADPGHGT